MVDSMIALVFAKKSIRESFSDGDEEVSNNPRISSIQACRDQNIDLLYQFKESKLDTFMSKKQNVILLEYYLQKYKEHFGAIKQHKATRVTTAHDVQNLYIQNVVRRKSKQLYKQLCYDKTRNISLSKMTNFSDLLSKKLKSDDNEKDILDEADQELVRMIKDEFQICNLRLQRSCWY